VIVVLLIWQFNFFRRPLFIATGLAFGTVLTLGVVPVLYSILFRVKQPLAA